MNLTHAWGWVAEEIRRLGRAAWILAQVGIALYGATVCGLLVARFTAGEQWMWVAFANNFWPWWTLGGLALAVPGLLSRWRGLLVALQVPGVVMFITAYGGLLLPHSLDAAPHAPSLTVAAYNVFSLKSDPARVAQTVAALDADVIGLEELGPDHAARLQDELSERYPYQALHPLKGVRGVGLLSRYPILEEHTFRPLPDSMLHLRTVLDIDGMHVTVIVAHPRPPANSAMPLAYDDSTRNTEIALLHDQVLAQETGPLIVIGDFNSTDQSDAYRVLDATLDDAFRVAGRGLGFTWPANRELLPRLIRIDYIWYDATFAATEARTGPTSGTSDHLPVIARLTWQHTTD